MGPEQLVALPFISGSISLTLNKLSDPVIKKFAQLYHMKSEFEKLQRTLERIQAVLEDAEERKIKEKSWTLWLTQLGGISSDAEDVLDMFKYKAIKRELKDKISHRTGSSTLSVTARKVRTKLSPAHWFSSISFRSRMAKEMAKIQGGLDEIAKHRKHLKIKFPNDGAKQLEGRKRARQSTSLIRAPVVVGRDDEEKEITRLLLASDGNGCGSNLSVVAIVRMGGLGKTTLAQHVYDDNEKKLLEHFQLKMWVHVSEDFNVNKVCEEIFEYIAVPGEHVQHTSNMHLLQERIKERLKEKRFLLVLDDVWDDKGTAWVLLQGLLKNGKEGSKVIVTTRNQKVARVMQAMEPILMLQGLRSEDSWLLFKACALLDDGSDRLRRLGSIGRDIVNQRLKGMPLAAKTIGGLLKYESEEWKWRDILESEVWDFPRQNEDDVFPALRLSYEYLLPPLKQCFTYCSLFPKGHKFNKPKLVQMWMAEGFIQVQGTGSNMEDEGEYYFHELVSLCFFDFYDKDRCTMHDLLHDLAKTMSQSECLRVTKGSPERPNECRHLSIYDNVSNPSQLSKRLKALTKLRTLFIGPIVPSNLLVEFKCLRVLDLSHSRLEQVQDICSLKLLRFLDLSYTKVEQLPESICKLLFLQTIRLQQSDDGLVPGLPKSMNQLTSLRHLEPNAAITSKIAGIGKLTALQRLDVFGASREEGYGIGELKDLNDVREGIRIQGLENIQGREEATLAELTKKTRLHRLELKWAERDSSSNRSSSDTLEAVLDALHPPAGIRELKITCYAGVRSPTWIAHQPLLHSLESICLCKCQKWDMLPPLGCLPNLRSLEIQHMNGVKEIGVNFFGLSGTGGTAGFLSLERLRFAQMTEWQVWSPEVLDVGNKPFPRLQYLTVQDCPKLNTLPCLPSTLKMLEMDNVGLCELPLLWGCDEWDTNVTVVGSSNSITNSGSSSNPCLSSIRIYYCKRLTSLVHGLLSQRLPTLEALEIHYCPELTALPALESFVSLRELLIDGCPELGPLPDDSHLPPSLRCFQTSGCPGLVNETLLAAIQHLPSAFFTTEKLYPSLTSCIREALWHLTELRRLHISHVEELDIPEHMHLLHPSSSSSSGESSAGEANVLFHYSHNNAFSLYADLQIRRWLPNVNHGLCSCTRSGLSECLQIRLTALRHLLIKGCGNIKSLLVEAVPQLLSLKSLHLEKCSDLSALPGEHLLCRLTLLEDLSITDCPELSGLGTIPAFAASLKILSITSCPKLASIPGELLHPLGSLQTLSIHNCDGLEQLGGLRALVSLQALTIMGCPRLRSLINEDGEDNRLGLEGLTNLRNMAIKRCAGLRSLPGGLEHLSSLKRLDIRRCPAVTSLGPLPSSLEKLVIHCCPALANSCRKGDGPDWHNIRHVPNIRLDRTIVQGFSHLGIIGD